VELEDTAAIVTGSGSRAGIGPAIALASAPEGAQGVVITYSRNDLIQSGNSSYTLRLIRQSHAEPRGVFQGELVRLSKGPEVTVEHAASRLDPRARGRLRRVRSGCR
jgi:NAD(P)-dependent dehydrogenase (short-subunit alcohol dehydrogenase family)